MEFSRTKRLIINLVYSAIFVALFIWTVQALESIWGNISTYIVHFSATNPGAFGFISLIILGLATFRMTRFITKDTILDPIREYIKWKAERSVIFFCTRQLTTCQWCASIWIATIVFLLLTINWATILLVLVFALSGLSVVIGRIGKK